MTVFKTCSALVAVVVLGAAAPALAQAPAPAPEAMVPAAPMVKAADDMTGAVGFGVGVAAGAQTLIAPNNVLFAKYWLDDTLAIVPQLTLGITKAKTGGVSGNTGWDFSPQVLALYVPWKATSTRLSVGAGLGLSLYKYRPGSTSTETHIGFNIPIYAGVEHFFARWFSMSVGMADDFFRYTKDGPDAYTLKVGVNTLLFQGLLTFYTD
jgi:hypothetical protein